MEIKHSIPFVYAKAFAYVFVPPLIAYFFLPYSLGVALLSFVYILIAGFFTIYLYLAKEGVCFLFALENIATLIQSGGQFSGVVYSSRDLYVNDDFEVIYREKKRRRRNWLGGLTLYGITPHMDILFIPLNHNKLLEKRNDASQEIQYYVQKTIKQTSRIDLKITNYPMFFGEMETKDRIQIFVILVVTLRVSNIYTFLRNRDPYGRLEEFLLAAFRDFVRSFSTDELIGKGIGEEIEATEMVSMLGKQFFDYLTSSPSKTNIRIEVNDRRMKIEDLGLEIINFSVLDIGLKDEAARKAAELLYEATKKAEVILIEAEAEADKIGILANAEANRIEVIGRMCEKFNVSVSLKLLLEKMGVAEANYLFYHGDFAKGIPKGTVPQFTEDDFKRLLEKVLEEYK
ncbi:MAG: SPFH domain-containing protein [Candidatus Paceibacterota bacterium]